jgi:predicted Zn-dependent protease
MRWVALVLCVLSGCMTLPQAAPPNELPEDDDPLTLAAESLTRKDEAAAAAHFERHLKQHPDQLMFRVHLADLYLKLNRDSEAKVHFERFAADAQDAGPAPQSQLVHCHTMLMEIAGRADDEFAERLHRGIGLVLLTRQNVDDAEVREEVLCQAITAMLEAKQLRPRDAKVHVWLAEVQERAGNHRAAAVSRATARETALPGDLTPRELRTTNEN